jgi:hypothetical protein
MPIFAYVTVHTSKGFRCGQLLAIDSDGLYVIKSQGKFLYCDQSTVSRSF